MGGVDIRGDNSFHSIINNTIVANGIEDTIYGQAGLSILTNIGAEVKNNIIVFNNGYGLRTPSIDHLCEIDYNNVWANVEGQYFNFDPGENDISLNPHFTDAFNGDFSLSALSPCIDAGNPESTVPEHGGDRIDIGAFEYYQPFNGFLTFGGFPQEVQTGSVITWDVSLMNPATDPQTVDAWIEYSGPSCGVAKRFLDITVPPGEWNETVEIQIPDNLPEGAYIVKGRVGIFGEEIWDSEVFDLDVLPGPKKAYVSQ